MLFSAFYEITEIYLLFSKSYYNTKFLGSALSGLLASQEGLFSMDLLTYLLTY
jgi:hypothetical protein